MFKEKLIKLLGGYTKKEFNNLKLIADYLEDDLIKANETIKQLKGVNK